MPQPLQQGLLYLWDRRTLYIDQLLEPLQLSQAAATLSVSLGEPMQVHLPATRQRFQCQTLLLPAGVRVNVDAGAATVATCYLDPLGEDHAALRRRARKRLHRVHYQLDDEATLQQCFRQLLTMEAAPDQAYSLLEQIIGRTAARAIDPRIVRVIEQIKRQVASNTPVEELAATVDLSVPRLMQLFKQQVGVPIRRYRQWHRLFVTASGVAQGLSLTDAALAAGFNDSSHFCHTFRNILGMKPSVILSQLQRIRLYAPRSAAEDASLLVGTDQ